MKRSLLTYFVLASLVAFSGVPPKNSATCTGAKDCKACKNCKYCKHCAKQGGTCGVCKKG